MNHDSPREGEEDWNAGPQAEPELPVSASTFMGVVGVVEILAGVLVLSRLTRLGAYVVSAWLVLIALNLLTSGKYLDVAVRDLVMAGGAFILGRLTEVRESAGASEPRAGAEQPEAGLRTAHQ
ncbi:MAG: hypothetical protein L0Y64_20755 [Myxococcaceae bacterium]|nr:hypothetical protein [Myxococcaceae bacterium]